jgi:glucosamine-6-phosphate isomerase
MLLHVFPDHHALSLQVASDIAEQVAKKPSSILCLAAGDTPKLSYNLLGEIVVRERIDFSKCSFIGLDEWVGIPPDNEGSCSFFLQQNLFSRLHIAQAQIHLFDAMAIDLHAECVKMDSVIRAKGGIDLMVVGVGMNGHIGFNEPGVNPELYTHVTNLDMTTQSVGQKYFTRPTTLKNGITLGLRHLMESRQVMVVASGAKKAAIMRQAIEGPADSDVPASIVRQHSHARTMLDRDAASSLTHESSKFKAQS